jgi:hypothetical protein
VYRAIRGSGSLQTELTYKRARALCEEVGDADRLLEVIYGQFVGAFNRPKLHDAERYASEFMEIAQHDHNDSALNVAEYLIGSTAFLLGDLVRARQHLEDSRVDGVDRGRVNRYSHGQYPTFPLTYLAWTMFALGFPNQGHALAGEAVAASRGGSEFYYAMVLSNGCYLHHMCGIGRRWRRILLRWSTLQRREGSSCSTRSPVFSMAGRGPVVARRKTAST